MMTKGAIGNLINRYEAVLQKCRLLNVFGSLAAALLLVAGSAGAATAFEGKFCDHVPEYPDFVVGGVSDVGPPAESTAKLENWQTGVAWGVDNGADTPPSSMSIRTTEKAKTTAASGSRTPTRAATPKAWAASTACPSN